MSTIYETKYYLLFDIIHLFTASSTVKTPKHTYAEDYCVGSEITKLPRKIMQTKLSNNLKIILILDGHNSKIYGPLMKIKTVFMNMRSIIGEFYQFNLSSCIRQQNSLTAQFVSFSLANLANIFYPPDFYNN